MESKFKDLRFNSTIEFEAWLKKETSKVIELEDYGQDIGRIWIHETGEILHCNFNAGIYNGKFIDMERLIVGRCLMIKFNDKSDYRKMGSLIVESIS